MCHDSMESLSPDADLKLLVGVAPGFAAFSDRELRMRTLSGVIDREVDRQEAREDPSR